MNATGSRWGNGLIKAGTKLVERVEDILEELSTEPLATHPLPKPPSFPLTPQEAELYTLLCQGVLQIDDIIVQSALTAVEVSATLLPWK